jgi:hypothetical protein
MPGPSSFFGAAQNLVCYIHVAVPSCGATINHDISSDKNSSYQITPSMPSFLLHHEPALDFIPATIDFILW